MTIYVKVKKRKIINKSILKPCYTCYMGIQTCVKVVSSLKELKLMGMRKRFK